MRKPRCAGNRSLRRDGWAPGRPGPRVTGAKPGCPSLPDLGQEPKPGVWVPPSVSFLPNDLRRLSAADGHPRVRAGPPPPQRAQQLQEQVSAGRGPGAGCSYDPRPAEGFFLPSPAQVSVREGDQKEEMHLSPADPRPAEPPQQGAAREGPRRGRERLLRAEKEGKKQRPPSRRVSGHIHPGTPPLPRSLGVARQPHPPCPAGCCRGSSSSRSGERRGARGPSSCWRTPFPA